MKRHQVWMAGLVVVLAAIMPSLAFSEVEAQRGPNGFVVGMPSRQVQPPVAQRAPRQLPSYGTPSAYPQGYSRTSWLNQPIGLVAVVSDECGWPKDQFALPLANALLNRGVQLDYAVQDVYILAVLTYVGPKRTTGGGGVFKNIAASFRGDQIEAAGYLQVIEGTRPQAAVYFSGTVTAKSSSAAYLPQNRAGYRGGNGGWNGQSYAPPASQVVASGQRRGGSNTAPTGGRYGGNGYSNGDTWNGQSYAPPASQVAVGDGQRWGGGSSGQQRWGGNDYGGANRYGNANPYQYATPYLPAGQGVAIGQTEFPNLAEAIKNACEDAARRLTGVK